MSMVSEESQWYVQKGARVQGPYTTTEVGRFLLLGRVRNTDRVSRDGELWEPVTQVPELIPEELLDLEDAQGWERFMKQRREADERDTVVSVVHERRRPGRQAEQSVRDDWSVASTHAPSLIPWSLLGLSLSVLAVVLYLNSTGSAG